MTQRIYRATVKGRFAELDDAARGRLNDELADHEVLVAGGYHEAGSLTYDAALDFFRYRVQVRADGDDPGAVAEERALAMALAELGRLDAGHGELQVALTDMASVWDGRRPRSRT